MKKSILITITAALLLAAVLCTAGCVEAPSDPIVGTYVAETDSAVSYAVFENDGTGYFAAAAETDDAAGVLQGTFDWTAVEPKKTYTLLFADGETETATLDAERGLLTIKEVVYQKYPSGFSGTAGVCIPDDSQFKGGPGVYTPDEPQFKLVEQESVGGGPYFYPPTEQKTPGEYEPWAPGVYVY